MEMLRSDLVEIEVGERYTQGGSKSFRKLNHWGFTHENAKIKPVKLPRWKEKL